mmetsp:Transcript_6766/g.15656  ORF Transcript_6766/g.15656 Transcript_6766/m.15656 type:complete len:411 (+) Transcript_6766:41-1273(+)
MQVSPDSHVEPLLDRERKQYFGNAFGVSSVVFCKGDADACLAQLKTRFRPVLDANLWLAGQFDKKKQLVYPKAATDELVDGIITKEDHPTIRDTTDYDGLVKSAGTISVQAGGKLLKTNGRVTRMVVVPISKEEFALVFSISHAVADGFTYWKIYNMFIGAAAVEAMTFQRSFEYEKGESTWIGKTDFTWLTSFGMIKAMIGGLIFGPKGKVSAFYVDKDKVAQLKKDAVGKRAGPTADIPFVSTNDVLTSHFRNATNCHIAWMTINLRNRVAAPITDLHVGNYEMPVLLDATNAKDPNVVRYNLNSGVPYTRKIPGPALPGFCGTCHNAFISNWSTFDFEMKLDGVEQKLMIPLLPIIPTSMVPFDVAIIFRPTATTLGVFYITKWGTREGLKGDDTPLGGDISNAIFG